MIFFGWHIRNEGCAILANQFLNSLWVIFSLFRFEIEVSHMWLKLIQLKFGYKFSWDNIYENEEYDIFLPIKLSFFFSESYSHHFVNNVKVVPIFILRWVPQVGYQISRSARPFKTLFYSNLVVFHSLIGDEWVPHLFFKWN